VVLLGQEEGARILAKLDPEQVDGIAREIAKISTIDPGEADRILTEFKSLFSSFSGQALNNSGGIPAARHLLYKAFGKEKGEALLKRAVPESQENPFSFIEDLEGEHAALLFKDESPTMAAMVLSRISPKAAAAVLASLEASKRMPLIRGMASLGKTNPEVLERVAAAMREKARSIGSVESRGVDGKSALAAILRNTDPSFGEQLLGELEEEDPELGRDLKERIYTLDDVVRADDRPIQERLRSMAEKDIALLLKGRSPEFIDKIRSNLSAGRRTMIEQERELLGPVPKKDVEDIGREFLSWFRLGVRDGKIRMDGDSSFI
jgi:flagellar motor switch protein FliG